MNRIMPLVWCGPLLMTIVAVYPSMSSASDVQTFLHASAWRLEYEITFTAQSQGKHESLHGEVDYTTDLKCVFNHAIDLDMRNAGSTLGMLQTAAVMDPSKMSLAEQQKFAMDMVAKVDNTANWMNSGGNFAEDATMDEQSAAMTAHLESLKGSGSLQYEEVADGKSLEDETGSKYSMHSRTTYVSDQAEVSSGQEKFELDAVAKEYLLNLGYGGATWPAVKVEVSRHIESTDYPPADTSYTEERLLSHYPANLVVDDPNLLIGTTLLFKGSFDPSAGKITGEHTVTAHYAGSFGETPGKMVVRYTLTPKE